MSLLLDALKKAAEQKAAKNKSEAPEGRSSDETLLDDGAEDITELMKGADDGLRQSRPSVRDETELDEPELETPAEQTRVEPQDRTDTRLETSDTTETEALSASAQMQTGEDETIIFAEDDVSDFMSGSAQVNREERTPDDETDLSQLAAREDDTDISQPIEARETRPQPADEDETQLRGPGSAEDQTDISQPLRAQETPWQRAAEDETQLGDPAGNAEDQTDISVPPSSVADLEYAEAQRAAASDETDISEIVESAEDDDDEDMSLLLVERDQTNLTTPPSSDTRRQGEQVEGLSEDSSVDDELGLVDTTRHRLPPEESQEADDTQSGDTATTGIALDTQTTRSSTTRTEPTSTRTYAPDNYDRTLMRLPNDDASKMFAGMKSDSDVVMTPEYAKKVFDSKSSAQRMQYFKFYSGIAAVILLAIFVYGLFEYQDQSNKIDDSLRALKRDPMPGVISSGGEQQSASLFPQAKVDERTIDIIENADSAVDEPLPDATVIAEETASGEVGDAAVEQVEPEVETEAAIETEIAVAPETELAMTETQADTSATGISGARDEADASAEIAIATTTTGTESSATRASSASSTLEISSSRQIAQKDNWLREAYAAYQAGNDELALELYNKVLKQYPRNRNALLARAAIHVQNDDSSAAIRDYQAILLDNPKDSLAMASLITVANYSPLETETQLKLMVREAPDSPYLNFALANAYSAQDRWQEAQGYYFRALQNNPGDPNYAYNLAVSLEHISQPRAAISYYQRALDNFGNGLATFSREVVDQRLEKLGKL